MSRRAREKTPHPKRHRPETDRLIAKTDLRCPPGLPIASHWEELRQAIAGNQVVIVSGETGSGKSTQLPKLCLLAGCGRRGRIVCTQPRRIAAITVAERLAQELGPLGPMLVGWRIRFQERLSPDSRVVFVTDGLLLAELQQDPSLMAYDVVIVDEAHERSINIDFMLGVLRRLCKKRPDLKVIITSATIDTAKFSKAFGGAPVFTISGRGFPVEIIYDPIEEDSDLSSAIIDAVELARSEDPLGNILIFLPTEKDIMETVTILTERYHGLCEVLPMFGRLSSAQQRRIFAPSRLPKLVVATNIAETSVTVPGISCVIDSGLARIARYNIRSRTKALPVSPISRASADQRAGRAGRVKKGICIRLYSEDDYLSRPEFTPPEIMRSNLAEVILRLKELNLGDPEEFPFVDPPSPRVVRDGMETLKELGAISKAGRLTRLGRLMARLPLDPRISRMLIEASRREALSEVVVIAAALSIQDPREFPLDKEEAAKAAHARLVAPFAGDTPAPSDFMTFLYLWRAYQGEKEKGAGKGRLRRFCREHFLSFRRMEEWADIVAQITSILKDSPIAQWNGSPASYADIHKSVLAGFLSNVALQHEKKRYKGAKGKELLLFPGSYLYKSPPKWIVAAELVETSRLFARTCAKVEPEWIEEVAGSQAVKSYSDPAWDPRRGEVMAREKVTLYGLTLVEGRRCRFAPVDPAQAREIFVRQGLAPADFVRKIPFVVHNRRVMEEVEALEERFRARDIMADPEALVGFFEQGLETLERAWNRKRRFRRRRLITGERELLDAIRAVGGDSMLRLTREILMRRIPAAKEMELFPGHVKIAGREVTLEYTFAPGTDEDGATAIIPLDLLFQMEQEELEWLIPGQLEEKITSYLKLLPKKYRRNLVPLSRSAERLMEWLEARQEKGRFAEEMREGLIRELGVIVPESEMPSTSDLPHHLRLRIKVVDGAGRCIGTGRDLNALKAALSRKASSSLDGPDWTRIKKRHEREGIRRIEELPQHLAPVEGPGGAMAYPALVAGDDGTVAVKLLPTLHEALHLSRIGAARLLRRHLAQEFDYLERNCIPKSLHPGQLLYLGGRERLQREFSAFLTGLLLGSFSSVPGRNDLDELAASLKGRVWSRARAYVSILQEILGERATVVNFLTNLVNKLNYSPKVKERFHRKFSAELDSLCGPGFLELADEEFFMNLPRYLKGLKVRMERCYADPAKDREKEARLEPFRRRMAEAEKEAASHGARSGQLLLEARKELEEAKIRIFAPELGTPRALPQARK